MISPGQVRAARAFLNWRQADLAKAAGISEGSVKNVEGGNNDSHPSTLRSHPSTLRAVQSALEIAGVIFIEENGDGPGVRLRKQKSAEQGTRPEDLNASNDG